MAFSAGGDGGNARANTIAVPQAKRAGRGRPARYRSSLIIRTGRSDDKLTTARQGDKNTAGRDQTRQSSADYRARHRRTKVNDAVAPLFVFNTSAAKNAAGVTGLPPGLVAACKSATKVAAVRPGAVMVKTRTLLAFAC